MRRRLVALSLVALIALGGCTKAAREGAIRAASLKTDVAVAAESPLKGDAEKAAHSPLAAPQLAFGFDLLRSMRSEGGNVVVSPLSISAALAMTSNGAHGGTREEMESALELDALGRDESNAAFADLMRHFETSKDVTLSMADGIWADSDAPVREDFIARDRDYFAARLVRMPFEDKRAVAKTVNDWVSEKTHGKITDLLDPGSIDEATLMELVNAVYFLGRWKDPFEPKDTHPGRFEVNGTTPRDVRMMSREGTMDYLETDAFQAVKLPYRGGVSMYVFLPKGGHDLAALEKSLTAEAWRGWTAKFATKDGSLQLPRFTLRTKAELSKPLGGMGMASAFDPNAADFTDMSPQRGWFIGRVDHQVYIDVDEQGTEAAAATAVGMMGASAVVMPQDRFVMRVDHPFFFAITDDASGVPLFVGSITDPTAK